jgi:hypothetical protein
MALNIMTNLPIPIHNSLQIVRFRVLRKMKDEGFKVEKHRLMRYGCVITFYYQGQKGWLMVYKSKNNRTTFSFGFILNTFVIVAILLKVRPRRLTTGESRFSIPNKESRKRIRWYVEVHFKKGA